MGRRKFSIADAMVLIAATAAGLAMARGYYAELDRWSLDGAVLIDPRISDRLPSRDQIGVANLPMASWTVALFALQWRSPRPRRRRLARLRGFTANLGAMVGLAFWGVSNFRNFVAPSMVFSQPPLFWSHTIGLSYTIGPIVAAAWVALAVGGRWRAPEPDWRGHAGRILGWGWIALFVLVNCDLGLLN
jgi:hypothetical protein